MLSFGVLLLGPYQGLLANIVEQNHSSIFDQINTNNIWSSWSVLDEMFDNLKVIVVK